MSPQAIEYRTENRATPPTAEETSERGAAAWRTRVAFGALLLAAALGGCSEPEGPAERAGKQIDELAEEVQEEAGQLEESLKEAGEEATEGAEEALDSLEEAADELEEEAEEATDGGGA